MAFDFDFKHIRSIHCIGSLKFTTLLIRILHLNAETEDFGVWL